MIFMNARICGIAIFIILVLCLAYCIWGKREDIQKKIKRCVDIFSIMVVLLPIIFPEKVAEYIYPDVNEHRIENKRLKDRNEDLQAENDALEMKNNDLEAEVEKLKNDSIRSSNNEDKNENTLEKTLKNIQIVNKDSRFEELKPYIDSYGNSYDIAHRLSGNFSGGFVVYDLQGNYTTFTGDVVAYTENSPIVYLKINVYKNNDEFIETVTGINKSQVAIEIGPYDVTGADNIRFDVEIDDEKSGNYDSGIADCCLVNVKVN